MRTLIFDVRPFEAALDDAEKAWSTGLAEPSARHSFISYELLHKVLAPNRMSIIQAMAGSDPLSIREIARRVGRDFKGVHTDVVALIGNGIVEKTADGKVVFPYDDIHFDFRISAARLSSAA